MRIDSLARPQKDPASYVIRVKDPALEADALRSQELAGQVRAALAARGLYEAPPNTKPDVIVELECGVGPAEMRPKHVMSALDRPEPIGPPTRVQSGTDEQGRPVYVERAVVRMRDGYYEMVPVYEKYLRVTARENTTSQEGRPPPEIWRVDVTTESESHDLRQVLPVLVAAGVDHLGTNSHGQKTVRIKETDASVTTIKGGL